MYDAQVMLAAAFALVVTLGAGVVVRVVFGVEYAASAPVLMVHAWAAVFVFIGTARGQEWVFAELNRLTLYTTVAGAVVNAGLNFWLIPGFGAQGAAWATLVSYAAAAWMGSWVFPASRATAWRQTKALLFPVFGWRYLWQR
jgi:O-antigen/teichoic acid export membrane protein